MSWILACAEDAGYNYVLEAGGCKYEFFHSTFAIIIMSIGYYVARERVMMAISWRCLCGGTRLSWLGLR